MPRSKLDELQSGSTRWPLNGSNSFRTEQWGDMEVGLTAVDAPLDCAPLYQQGGLPGGVCPCPHYGYVFTGRLRASYPGSDIPDEVIKAGEAYFIPSGHTLAYEEPSRVLEFNPAAALQMCMDAMQRSYERMASAGLAPTGELEPTE